MAAYYAPPKTQPPTDDSILTEAEWNMEQSSVTLYFHDGTSSVLCGDPRQAAQLREMGFSEKQLFWEAIRSLFV